MGRLSEDLRLGALMKGQAFGEYELANGKTCAVAAICDARGTLSQWDDAPIRRVEMELDLLAPRVQCPKCQMGNTVGGMVIHLNDFHRMRREEIADWLATVEQQQAQPEAVTA